MLDLVSHSSAHFPTRACGIAMPISSAHQYPRLRLRLLPRCNLWCFFLPPAPLPTMHLIDLGTSRCGFFRERTEPKQNDYAKVSHNIGSTTFARFPFVHRDMTAYIICNYFLFLAISRLFAADLVLPIRLATCWLLARTMAFYTVAVGLTALLTRIKSDHLRDLFSFSLINAGKVSGDRYMFIGILWAGGLY